MLLGLDPKRVRPVVLLRPPPFLAVMAINANDASHFQPHRNSATQLVGPFLDRECRLGSFRHPRLPIAFAFAHLSQWRNHHPGGQSHIEFFISQHYPSPPQSDVAAWLWMSQVSQGYCIRQQTEHYRRLRSACELTSSGGGCNAGAMFWQANDVWPGPSWAAIE